MTESDDSFFFETQFFSEFFFELNFLKLAKFLFRIISGKFRNFFSYFSLISYDFFISEKLQFRIFFLKLTKNRISEIDGNEFLFEKCSKIRNLKNQIFLKFFFENFFHWIFHNFSKFSVSLLLNFLKNSRIWTLSRTVWMTILDMAFPSGISSNCRLTILKKFLNQFGRPKTEKFMFFRQKKLSKNVEKMKKKNCKSAHS